MSYKFFYLYFIGATVALLLLIYQCAAYYPKLNIAGIVVNAIPVVLLYYLALKVWLEKKDKDLM
jgi:hypothetical protein